MPAMLTAFAWVKEEVLLSFPRLGSPNPGVIPSYPAAQRRPLRRNTCPLFDSLLSQDPLFCSCGVEPDPTAEIVSGCILAAPLLLEI